MKLIKHLMTVIHHRHLVFIHCVKAGITFQGLFHDLSKFSLDELIPSVKYYVGTHSPTEVERKANGYSKAWLHHKGRNKHHWEYWRDYDESSHVYKPVPMPIKYFKEMFCDRVAASKTYLKEAYKDDAPFNYFHHGHGKSQMHEHTRVLLAYFLILLKEEGEKECFKKLKALKSYEEVEDMIWDYLEKRNMK